MWLNVIYAKLNCEPMQSAVSSSVRMWSVGWPLLILWVHCISCWHFELIFADLVLKRIFADSGFQLFPPFFWGLCVGKYGVRWVFSTEFLQYDHASWQQRWFPLTGLPWIPPCYVWGAQAPVQPLRHQFPSSSIDDEFKYSVSRGIKWTKSNTTYKIICKMHISIQVSKQRETPSLQNFE